jgi:hypothetical protein
MIFFEPRQEVFVSFGEMKNALQSLVLAMSERPDLVRHDGFLCLGSDIECDELGSKRTFDGLGHERTCPDVDEQVLRGWNSSEGEKEKPSLA